MAVHVAGVEARLRRGTGAARHRLHAVLGGRAAGRADGAVADAVSRRPAGRFAHPRRVGSRRPGGVGGAHLGAAGGERPHSAPFPGSGDHRFGVSRRQAAGERRHGGAPRTPGLLGSLGRAARPSVRARPHVHVALHHLRVAAAARRHHRPAHVDPPGVGVAGAIRAADGAGLDMAAGGGTRRRRGRCPSAAAGAPSVRRGDHGAARQGSARNRHPRPSGARAARRLAALVRPGFNGAVGQRRVAHWRLGRVRCGLRRRRDLRGVRHGRFAGRGAVGAGGRFAAFRLHRRRGGGDRVPARHLDGWLEAHGLAGGLRGSQNGTRRPAGAGGPPPRHRVRGRDVRLSRHRSAGPARRQPQVAGRPGGGAGGRERRRQDDAGEAPRQDV